MPAFDASSIIHAWDNYPIEQIPGLWKWIEREIRAGEFVIPQVAYEEIGHKSPDCTAWLKSVGIKRLSIDEPVLMEAQRIKLLLGIQEDKYHPKGVGENDLFIIACARNQGILLVTDESPQNERPKKLAQYKIPRLCGLPDVSVPCVSFLTLFKESKVVV